MTNENKIAEYDVKINALKKLVVKVKITDDTTNQGATDLTKSIKDLGKEIESQRKKEVKPLDDKKKTIQAKYKPLTDAIKQAETDIKNEVLNYSRIVAEKNRLISIANEKKTEKYNEKMLDGKNVKAPLLKTEETGKASGQSIIKTIKWEIDDESKIPREYLILNEQMISKVIKAGAQIPGIKTFIHETVRIG